MQQSSLKQVVLDFHKNFVFVGFSGKSCPTWKILLDGDEETPLKSIAFYRTRFSSLMQTVFNDYIHSKPRNCQVLVVEPLFWPKVIRDSLFTCLLLEYQVASVSFQPQPSMAIIATGLANGLFVSISGTDVSAMCFSDGRPIMTTHCSDKLDDSDSFTVEKTAEVVLNALRRSPVDVRRSSASHIICFGESVEEVKLSLSSCLSETAGRIESFRALSSLQFHAVDTIFPSVLMAWIGGSLFSVSSSNISRFITRDHLSSPAEDTCAEMDRYGLTANLFAPDWLSTSKSQWIFTGTTSQS